MEHGGFTPESNERGKEIEEQNEVTKTVSADLFERPSPLTAGVGFFLLRRPEAGYSESTVSDAHFICDACVTERIVRSMAKDLSARRLFAPFHHRS